MADNTPTSTNRPYSMSLGGGTLIVSRITPKGIQVSDSYMVVGAGLQQAINNINNDPAWVEHCAQTLSASSPSILQKDPVKDALKNKIIFGTRPSKLTFGKTPYKHQYTYVAKNMTINDINLMRSTQKVEVRREFTPTDDFKSGFKGMLIPIEHPNCIVNVECDSKGRLLEEGAFIMDWAWSGTFRLTSRQYFK